MQASQSLGDDRTRDSVLPAAERPASQEHGYMALDRLAASLTRFEMAIVRVHEAFWFWARELQRYTSGHPLSFQEVALLHCVRPRGGSTTLAEMMIRRGSRRDRDVNDLSMSRRRRGIDRVALQRPKRRAPLWRRSRDARIGSSPTVAVRQRWKSGESRDAGSGIDARAA